MRRLVLAFAIGICIAGLAFAAGFLAGRGSHAAWPTRSDAPAPPEDGNAEREHRARIARFPTVVMEVSKMPDYYSSPYPDWLIKMRCRGVPENRKKDFLAVFQCVGGRKPLEAAGLEQGMRLRLDMIPFESRPEHARHWAMADDVDDLSLPVYWVGKFEHDEPLLRLATEPARARFATLLDQTVLKAPISIPCGDVQAPFFFYGANWQIYKADATERLFGARTASPYLAVKHLHDWLAARGVRLIFAPIPQSASIFPDVAMGRFEGATLKGEPANTAARELLAKLRREGIATIDFAAEMAKHRTEDHEGRAYPIYLPNDTHWAPGGARIAALQAARELINGGFIQPSAAGDGAAGFKLISLIQNREGDIGQVSAVVNLGVKVAAVPMLCHQLVSLDDAAKLLLQDPGSEAQIHCVGDSYLLAFRDLQAGFVDHMAKETGQQVHVTAGLGCGHHAAMRGWLREGVGKAKVLLWMPSERYLGYDEWIDVLAESTLPQ